MTFSVHIGISRYCTENVSVDGVEERTTAEQWNVIEQIMVIETRVVVGSAELKEINLSIELNDSREFLPHLVLSHCNDMGGGLMVSPNMLTLRSAREVMVLTRSCLGPSSRRVWLGTSPQRSLPGRGSRGSDRGGAKKDV